MTDMFQNGDKIDISGISKGKGFQGTIKRLPVNRADPEPMAPCTIEELDLWAQIRVLQGYLKVKNYRVTWELTK